MKIAALIVGLIGAMLTLGLGAKWVKDFEDNKRLVASLEQMAGATKSSEMDAALSEVSRTRNAGYLMVVLGIAARESHLARDARD